MAVMVMMIIVIINNQSNLVSREIADRCCPLVNHKQAILKSLAGG